MKRRSLTSKKAAIPPKIMPGDITHLSSHILNSLTCLDSRQLDSMMTRQHVEELYSYFESLIAAMPNYVYLLDRNCILLGGNDNLARLFGLKSRFELAGLTYEQMAKLASWPVSQSEIFKKIELEVMATGEARLNIEEPPVIINGKTRYFVSSKVPLYNVKNEIVGVMSTSTDITECKMENIYLKNVINKLPGSIYWKDREGVYLGCNDFVLDMAGMKSMVGKTDFDMPWQKYAPQIRNIDISVMETNKPIELEEHPTLSNGQQIVMLTRKAPLKDEEGNILGIMGVSVDITERKKLEAALKEATNRAKTEFLENMRHDIRTPLTGITGFASIIRDEVKDPKIREDIDSLTASSYALLDLLNEILEIVKVNAGELPQLKKKFDLKKRLSQVIKLNQAKALSKHIDLVFEYDETIPRYLIGDSTRIHRIALELVANALNFTDKGYVKLITQLAKATDRGVVVKIMVEDTGIGISSDQQQEIFLQFKRLTPSYKGIYKGAGLGLAIVRQFLEELEGEIYVESQVGVGTKFTCLIPLKESLLDDEFGCEDAMSTTEKTFFYTVPKMDVAKSNNEETILSSYRVLVVEDSPIASLVAKDLLIKLDCQVDIAPDGKTAIRLAKNNSYDLIFMDIGLPDMDGNEVAKRIRLHELNKRKSTPIIALTAHMDEENKQRCIEAGINAILTKPLVKEKAEDILNTFIFYRKRAQKQEVEPHLSVIKEPSLFYIEGKIIDAEAAKKVLGNNEDAFYQMLDLLQASLTEEVAKLRSAYNEEDWQAVQSITHKMKGGCAYCGAIRLKEACARLEIAIKSKKPEVIADLYTQVVKEVAAVKEAIETKNY